MLAFGLSELEAADELEVGYGLALAGGELIPENDLAFAFAFVLAVGVVELLITLGPYRAKVGDWASTVGLDLPPPADDEGDDSGPLNDNLGLWA